MKNLCSSVLVCLLALSAQVLTAKAESIIYADTFTGTGDLSGAKPTVDNGGFGGVAGAKWNTPSGVFTETGAAVGAPAGTPSTVALLPFGPQSGQIYTLTLTVASTGTYGEVGFNMSSTGVTSQLYYQDGTHDNVDWALDGGAGGGDQTFAGPGTATETDSGTGDGEFVLTLDTTKTLWTYSILAPGATKAVTGAYSTNPTINGVGFGELFGAGATFSGFSLTTNLPEPSTYALLGLGMLGLLFVGRRAKLKS